ncbi:MAG: hypothetical protein DCF18_01395 [Cyanobium sp.]|jgi:hypothetical protein|uniref:hypothetical protein n=1 Tax=unclassified Synechococcus TaxID=2626047 RepID=UPI000DBBF593|nr:MULTISPECIES: hypothetical protein [unclassified Synechococcus]MCP9828352.1 hypothetical protein [Synechococcus sp. L2F]MCP9847255.1 hypothetical protein [Synechococcus sp. Lug-A]MCT0209556.1 hypothetical protein [Synechococcus sp. CS-1333]PZV24751.1 MAG: hypothetical protein DCF18_01395 [Cyanobium sp.]
MFRWFLIGLAVVGTAVGLERGWVTVDGCRFMQDTKLPTLKNLQPDAAGVCPEPGADASPADSQSIERVFTRR